MYVRSMLVSAAALALLLSSSACRRPEGETSSTRTTSATPAENTAGGTTTTTTPQRVGDTTVTSGQTGTMQPGTPQSGVTSLADDDMKFLRKATEGSLMEIGAARHVQEAGSNAEVKGFAGKILADHTKAHEELQKLAVQKGVVLPTEMSHDHDEMSDMTKLAGMQLDKKYAKEMVDDHEKDVKEFRDAAKDLKDPDIRAWAQKTIPVLEDHLIKAKQLEKKLK